MDCKTVGARCSAIAVFVLAMAVSQGAMAASPVLSNLAPRGAQRGTEMVLTLSGDRLTDAQELLFYEPGIEVAGLEIVSPQVVKATLKIAADAPLGSHRLRVRTATGISELRPFFVGALPVVDEKEPNSEFAAAQPVPMNTTVHGVVDNEDVDYFVVEAKKGDRITAEVEAIRLGITLFDVYVAILNKGRFELSRSDDAALLFQDGVASIIAPEDGPYIVQIRDSAYGGNGACLYRAHIGTFPRPVAVLPAGGKLGEAVGVRYLGDVSGEMAETVQLPTAPNKDFLLFPRDDRGIAPSGIRFRLSEFGNVIEQEPNETMDNATRFTAPLALNGVIGAPGDVDHYRFAAKAGETYDIRVHARSIRSALDPVLVVYNAQGGALASNDDSGGPDSYLRFAAPADGEFVIGVFDHLRDGAPTYAYRVELTPVKPELVLTVNEFVQYVQPTVTVPKGNRYAVVLSTQRVNFGGPLAFRGERLPAGVTIEAPPMPPGSGIQPVMFHAAADAATSGTLADIIGALSDPNQPNLSVSGAVQQTIALVRGQNNTPFWVEATDKLPVAVADEAAFSLQIVEPKVPIVRGGTMELKVVATRKDGFKAPIKVDMLWLPPGIGASGSVAIAEGATEAVIPMNAAANAELATWKIAIRGQSDSGAGPFEVCSPFANLRVAEKYLTFAFDQAAVEQGKETDLVIKMEKQYDFPGTAKVELLGLPNKVTTTVQEITKDTTEIVFHLTTDMTSPAGNHNNLLAKVVVMENDEPVTHILGTGKLRVDVPLPPKKNDPPPMPAPTPAPMPEQKPAEPMVKRLTRLEQLRLEQAERDKAKKAAGGG